MDIGDIQPEILGIHINDTEDGFFVDFSETLDGPEEVSHYKVLCDGKEQVIKRVAANENKDRVEILLKNHLRNTGYTIEFSDLFDTETGKNSLRNGEQFIEVQNVTEWTLGDRLKILFREWLPLVLAIVVLLIIIFIIIFTRRLKHRHFVVVNGEVVKGSNIKEQYHVEVEPKKDGIPLVMWISNGKDEPKKVDCMLDGSLCVGRSSRECDVYCDDPMMSKQHFMLSFEKDGHLYITDLESTNGTSVNGIQIKEKWKLMPRDEVSAGNLKFFFEL